jgi:DNA-binding response OmpR family regulator
VRVLVVEDEEGIALGVRRALESDGHIVDDARDGRRGLEKVLTGGYDLVILDVMLPGVNGFEICRTARRAAVTSSILMLSAKSGEWDVAEALDLGADDYLRKPFSTVELLARVRVRARAAVDAAATELRTGSLRFEPAMRRVWKGREQVDLTGRETALLAVLFHRIGEVVTKEDLLAAVWGHRYAGAKNVVEVYAGRLRRKLDDPVGGEDSLLETIRGVGYRLIHRPATDEG